MFEYVVGRKTKSKPICVLKGDLISAIYGDQEKGTVYVMSPTTIGNLKNVISFLSHEIQDATDFFAYPRVD